ncbi:MAG: InlB B-repeat-containing protein, partial [Ruminiclostridium sp.]|nr:InlB B-repeat-containing protein [Ruminiclostridium sp.]
MPTFADVCGSSYWNGYTPPEGETFSGWQIYSITNEYNAGSEGYDFTIIFVPSFAASHTITYHISNGTNSSDNPTSYIEGVGVATIAAAVPDTGYEFGGWFDNPSYSGTAITSIPATANTDIDLYAKITLEEYSITFNNNGGTFAEGYEPPTSYTLGTEVTLPTAENITYSGKVFEGWLDEENLPVTEITSDSTGDRTFFAQWRSPEIYTIKYHENGGEYVGEYEPPATYTEGVGATLPTADNITKENSTFVGWHDNESLTGDPITAVGNNETDNKEFWAEWTGKTAITPVVTMSDYEYDGTAHEATVSGIPDDYDGEITVTYSGTGTTTYASSTTAPKNAGSYSVSVTVTETANYASASAVVNYTIDKAPLYITPKEYSISFYDTSIDVTNAEKTGYIIDDSCLKTGDTPSSVYEGFNFDNYFTYQYMSYPAEGDFLQLYDRVGGDYDIVLYYDESVLYPAFEEKNPNYSIYPLYGKLNIVPKELTITWTNNTFPYDGDPHAPTASFDQNEFYYQSFDIPGESEPYIVSDFGDFNGAVLTITGDNVTEGKAINVGNYTATATLSFNDDDVAACYVIKEGDETYNFTITPTDLTVTAPEGINADYTGTAQELVSGGSVKFGDTTVGSFVYAVTSDTTEPGEGAYSADVPERTDAGTYYVWYKAVTENTNYNIPAPAYVTAKINPVSLTVTATTPDTISYGDAAPTYTATFTGLKGTDTTASVGTVTFSCTYEQGSDAGDYTITPTITTADRGAKYSNYSITFAEGTLTVSPKAVTVTITGHSDTKDYTGSEQSVSGYDASSDSDLYDTDYIVFSGTASAVGTNVGTYDMELAASQFSNSNTNFTVTFEVTDGSLTITAVPATVTAPDANNRIYDGTEKALVTGGSATGGTLVYALGTNETDAPTTFGDDVPVGTDVGDYYVWYYAKPDSNHTASAKGCVKVTITAASMTITAPNANNRDYDGTEDVLVTGGSVTGGTMKYALGNNETTAPIDDKFTTTVPTGTYAGDYYVWYWAVPLTGYSEDTSTPACEKVTINPKAIAVTITGHTDSVDYDAAEHTVSGYDAVCTDTLYDASKIVCSVSASVTGTNAGTYPMGLSADEFGYDDNNFSATFTVTDGQLEIKKAAINPSVSITGWTYGQTANTPVLAEGSNPGGATPVYKYKAASAADTTYTTTVPVNKGDYTLKVEIPETNNYLAGSDTADFTISPATLTIKADDIEIDYGSAIPDFTVTYDTLVNGDSAADIGVVTYTCSYTATSVASTYSIEPEVTTQGTAYSNYSISYENGTLTVNKLAITPTISIDESKVYDGLPITAATVSGNPGSGLVTFYYTGRDGTTYEASIPPTAVGKYSVYATVGESANYKAGVTGTADFEITAADISPSVSITGWTYGETPNAPSLADGSNPGGGEVKYFYIGRDGTTYEESEYVPTQAGKYTVKAVIPATDNYNGNVATADFTISPKTVAIEWTDTSLTYNGADQKPTATAANLETGDTCTITVDGAKKNASATAYTATATEVSNPNYKLPTENTTSFSITEKEIGINWGTTTFEYDGENHAPTATPTGVVDGDTCDITVTGAEKNVGTYTATASITNTNYKLPTENTTSFSITEKEIGINWGTTTFEYDGENHAPTATPTGVVTGDSCDITVTGAEKNVGTYTATASITNTNYKLPT